MSAGPEANAANAGQRMRRMTARALVLSGALLTGGIVPAGLGAQAAGGTGGQAPNEAEGPDVFDASTFDQNVQQSRQQETKTKLETQFGGNLLYDTSATTTTAFTGYGAGGTFAGKAFLKVSVPDTGAFYLAYNYSKNLYQGAAGTVPGSPFGMGGPALAQSAGDLYGVQFDLAEFYASFDVAKSVFLRVGNQLLAWGPSVIWTPVDFINLQRVNPLSPLDLRVGRPGIRATVPMGISDFFLFVDLSGTVTPAGSGAPAVNDLAQTTNLGARWDITVGGVELGLTGYGGYSIPGQAGFDFSGRFLGFDVYGELGTTAASGGSSFTWASSLGIQRTLGELGYWTVAGELFYNDAGTTDTSGFPALAVASTFNPLYVGKFYSYAAVTRTHLGMDRFSATLAAFVDWSDGSFLGKASTGISLPGVPPFTFGVSWSGGGPGKAFTYITGNNALSAELEVKVEF